MDDGKRCTSSLFIWGKPLYSRCLAVVNSISVLLGDQPTKLTRGKLTASPEPWIIMATNVTTGGKVMNANFTVNWSIFFVVVRIKYYHETYTAHAAHRLHAKSNWVIYLWSPANKHNLGDQSKFGLENANYIVRCTESDTSACMPCAHSVLHDILPAIR